ncbi:MAG: bifunctional tRNA (5-methylaminomethyl-2-thiouridine)(34)-methyltransferase MnmD/FAD-dependent 5-carboxymethylaminomethyl-2-thiouridine(34) oxidoreductase MnmC [Halothiobacillaceae bacterium]
MGEAVDWPLVPATLAVDDSGVPRAPDFDDLYFSADGGLDEVRHVFLAGNDLPARFAALHPGEVFTILETGFGTGLNFLVTWAAFVDRAPAGARLHFVSVEAHPLRPDELVRIHAGGPLAGQARQLAGHWPDLIPGLHRRDFDGGRIVLTLGFGEALSQVSQLRLSAQALFLDGFSPAKNPAMWRSELISALAARLVPGATFSTFSAARAVREALAGAGFAVHKRPGFGRKRDMLCGQLEARPAVVGSPDELMTPAPAPEREAMVIGAGLAGCSVVSALARRGWQVTLLERHPAPAGEASGNPAGIFLPVLSRDWNALSALTGPALGYLRSRLADLDRNGHGPQWSASGVLRLARGTRHLAQQARIAERLRPDPDFARQVSVAEASGLAGVALEAGGWWFPGGGWINPPSLCRAWLSEAGPRVTARYGARVARLTCEDGRWLAWNAQDELLAQAPRVVIANAQDALALLPDAELPLRGYRGQISAWPARSASVQAPRVAVCREGYVLPARKGIMTFGATFQANPSSMAVESSDHLENLQKLAAISPTLAESVSPAGLGGRVGMRCASPDRLPLVGLVADPVRYREIMTDRVAGRQVTGAAEAYLPGLAVTLGHGARGLTWTGLLGEWLAAQWSGEPGPLPMHLERALHPARFAWRALKRGQAAGGP